MLGPWPMTQKRSLKFGAYITREDVAPSPALVHGVGDITHCPFGDDQKPPLNRLLKVAPCSVQRRLQGPIFPIPSVNHLPTHPSNLCRANHGGPDCQLLHRQLLMGAQFSLKCVILCHVVSLVRPLECGSLPYSNPTWDLNRGHH